MRGVSLQPLPWPPATHRRLPPAPPQQERETAWRRHDSLAAIVVVLALFTAAARVHSQLSPLQIAVHNALVLLALLLLHHSLLAGRAAWRNAAVVALRLGLCASSLLRDHAHFVLEDSPQLGATALTSVRGVARMLLGDHTFLLVRAVACSSARASGCAGARGSLQFSWHQSGATRPAASHKPDLQAATHPGPAAMPPCAGLPGGCPAGRHAVQRPGAAGGRGPRDALQPRPVQDAGERGGQGQCW